MRYNTGIAYLLWVVTFFGFGGIHRFYLGKKGTGVLWLLTWGLFGIGTIYDGVTLTKQVREANVRAEVDARVRGELGYTESYGQAAYAPPPKSEDREKTVLRVARANEGFVTPGEAALEGDMTVDEARKLLEKLAAKGNAEMRVRTSGVVVYFFPEFAKDRGDDFAV
jgi:hypothetical protein